MAFPQPVASIGVPVYNTERYIAGALDSLLAQTFPDFEIIISDNASNDGTRWAAFQEGAAPLLLGVGEKQDVWKDVIAENGVVLMMSDWKRYGMKQASFAGKQISVVRYIRASCLVGWRLVD